MSYDLEKVKQFYLKEMEIGIELSKLKPKDQALALALQMDVLITILHDFKLIDNKKMVIDFFKDFTMSLYSKIDNPKEVILALNEVKEDLVKNCKETKH